jgi:hypothetical protein
MRGYIFQSSRNFPWQFLPLTTSLFENIVSHTRPSNLTWNLTCTYISMIHRKDSENHERSIYALEQAEALSCVHVVVLLLDSYLNHTDPAGKLRVTSLINQLKDLTKEYIRSYSPHVEQLLLAIAETPTQLNPMTGFDMYVCVHVPLSSSLTSTKAPNAFSSEPRHCLMPIY